MSLRSALDLRDKSPTDSMPVSCGCAAAQVGTTVVGITIHRYLGVTHGIGQASRRGVLRHVLAGLRRHRAAVLAAPLGATGIGLVGVSPAFGLAVVTMASAVGHISGCHFDPAVTIGLWVGGRFPAGRIGLNDVAQVLGAMAASAVLWVSASGKAGFTVSDGFTANGHGDHFPAGHTMLAAIVVEPLITFFFLLVIHGVTDRRARPVSRLWPSALRSPSSTSSASRWTTCR